MKKSAILTLVGLGLLVGGIAVGYFYLKSINDGPNYIFLILSLILVVASFPCLYFATNPRKPKVAPVADLSAVDTRTANAIAQNNTVLAEWNKTNDTRDRLKILKIAGAEKEEEAPQ